MTLMAGMIDVNSIFFANDEGAPSPTTIQGHGIIDAKISLHDSTEIIASGGTLQIGDSNQINAFSTRGRIVVEADGVLDLRTKLNFAPLGSVTELEGGTIIPPTGVLLRGGDVVTGSGAIASRLVADAGSTINATGDLALGDVTRLDGYYSRGELIVNDQTVTLNDANRAVLGSMTTVGNADGPGTLNAPNGITIEFANNLAGYGTILGNVLNNGFIHGGGPGVLDYLDLQGLVNGVGDFGGTVAFSGGFSPGLSPTEVNGENFIFNSHLIMEIGGTTPGTEYDVINATGFIKMGGILEIVLLNGFEPELGQAFEFFHANQFLGSFDEIIVPIFNGNTLRFDNGFMAAVAPVPVPGRGLAVRLGARRARGCGSSGARLMRW